MKVQSGLGPGGCRSTSAHASRDRRMLEKKANPGITQMAGGVK